MTLLPRLGALHPLRIAGQGQHWSVCPAACNGGSESWLTSKTQDRRPKGGGGVKLLLSTRQKVCEIYGNSRHDDNPARERSDAVGSADIRHHLHGDDCEFAVRLDAVRQSNRQQISLGSRCNPSRVQLYLCSPIPGLYRSKGTSSTSLDRA